MTNQLNLIELKEIFGKYKILILFTVGIFLILMILIWSITIRSNQSQVPPKVINTNPQSNQEKIAVDTQISVVFDNTPKSEINLVANPQIEIKQTRVLDNQIVFTPNKKLEYDTAYNLGLYLENTQIYNWKFKTISAIESAVSKLPTETSDFIIKAVPHDNSYRFYIRHKSLPPEKVTAEVIEWFGGEGISDISNLDIIWSPVPGSLIRPSIVP